MMHQRDVQLFLTAGVGADTVCWRSISVACTTKEMAIACLNSIMNQAAETCARRSDSAKTA